LSLEAKQEYIHAKSWLISALFYILPLGLESLDLGKPGLKRSEDILHDFHRKWPWSINGIFYCSFVESSKAK
jgi:hypothetical protein